MDARTPKHGPKAGRGVSRDLGAGPFQALIDSYELHLLAERKAPKTVRTYTEAAQWLAAATRPPATSTGRLTLAGNRIMTVTVPARACEHCGAMFTPRRRDARYCCDVHRAAHGRASRTEPNAARPDSRSRSPAAVRAEPAAVPAWDPPSQPRKSYQAAEPCPDCGNPLRATPRSTWRACLTCGRPVTPPGVLAPYQRGQGQGQARQVRSQAERDLDAIALARRKGVMLSQLGVLADDARLDPASLPVVEWFAEEVQAAKSGGRLDELAALLPQAGIRRQHWWQGEAAAIGTFGYDDQADHDGEDLAEAEDDHPPAAIEAAAVPAVDYAAELAARNWVLRPHGTRICHVVDLIPRGWDYVPPQECLHQAAHLIPGGAVCHSCHDALCMPLYGAARAQRAAAVTGRLAALAVPAVPAVARPWSRCGPGVVLMRPGLARSAPGLARPWFRCGPAGAGGSALARAPSIRTEIGVRAVSRRSQGRRALSAERWR